MRFTYRNFLPPFGLSWTMFAIVFVFTEELLAIVDPPNLFWRGAIGGVAVVTCLAWADYHGTRKS